MTTDQIEICRAFERVTCLPGTWDKRMINSLISMAWMEKEIELTEKQNLWMFRLLYKYRKQIPNVYSKYMFNPLCRKI